MKQENRPLFIAFEGIDGAGKSTQVNMLAEALKKQGEEVIKTREPGGTETADEIRSLVLNAKKPLTEIAELLLMFAARAEHIENLIKPSLAEGKSVITDRFTLSSYAYQGYGNGGSLEEIKWFETTVLKELQPDITFLIDLPEEQALMRAKKRQQPLIPDRFEMMELKFFKRVRQGFLSEAKKRDNIIILDGTKPQNTLHEEILKSLK